MKRVKISLTILALLVSVSVFSSAWTASECRAITEDISRIEALYTSGDIESAAALVKKANERWEEFRSRAVVLLGSSRLTDIDRISLRLVGLIGEGSDEVLAELNELREKLRLLKSTETPSLTSIL